jgi:hypothetical protein
LRTAALNDIGVRLEASPPKLWQFLDKKFIHYLIMCSPRVTHVWELKEVISSTYSNMLYVICPVVWGSIRPWSWPCVWFQFYIELAVWMELTAAFWFPLRIILFCPSLLTAVLLGPCLYLHLLFNFF